MDVLIIIDESFNLIHLFRKPARRFEIHHCNFPGRMVLYSTCAVLIKITRVFK